MTNNNKQRRFFEAVKRAKHDPNYGDSRLRKIAKSMTESDIDSFSKSIAEAKIKKAILSILKEGDSDSDVIVKEFSVEGKYEEYVKRFIGQKLSEKEMEAVNTFQDIKPTKIESNLIRYETTDAFKNNTATIIKKLREGADFVYVAFTKYNKTEKPAADQLNQPSGLSGHADFGGPIGGGMGGGMGGMGSGASPMLENEDLGSTDQPTPSNDMSIPTDPDFGSGTPPTEEGREYWKKFLTKNESKLYLNWPEKKINEQGPMDSTMGGGNNPSPPMTSPMDNNPPFSPTGPSTTTAPTTGTPKSSEQQKKEMGIDDILIRKSTPFKDEIKGGEILADFLKNLDL